jgi:hypothetical protein
LILVHLASGGISFPCSSGARRVGSDAGLAPNLSLEFLRFAEGIGMAPGREGDEPKSPVFFGRIAIERIASSSPNDPWLLLKLLGEAGSKSFSPWFGLNKSVVLITRPICGAFECLDEFSLSESSSDDPSVL